MTGEGRVSSECGVLIRGDFRCPNKRPCHLHPVDEPGRGLSCQHDEQRSVSNDGESWYCQACGVLLVIGLTIASMSWSTGDDVHDHKHDRDEQYVEPAAGQGQQSDRLAQADDEGDDHRDEKDRADDRG